jgi:hypothetical protein
MPAPKSSNRNDAFNVLSETSGVMGENNDCGVKAVAAATGVSYMRAHQALAKLGREGKEGTHFAYIRAAIEQFGFRLVDQNGGATTLFAYNSRGFDVEYFTQHYPGAHKKLQSVTTHHPERFPKATVWAGRTFLMLTNGGRHIVCIKDGETIDWTKGKAKRAFLIVEVVPA